MSIFLLIFCLVIFNPFVINMLHFNNGKKVSVLQCRKNSPAKLQFWFKHKWYQIVWKMFSKVEWNQTEGSRKQINRAKITLKSVYLAVDNVRRAQFGIYLEIKEKYLHPYLYGRYKLNKWSLGGDLVRKTSYCHNSYVRGISKDNWFILNNL